MRSQGLDGFDLGDAEARDQVAVGGEGGADVVRFFGGVLPDAGACGGEGVGSVCVEEAVRASGGVPFVGEFGQNAYSGWEDFEGGSDEEGPVDGGGVIVVVFGQAEGDIEDGMGDWEIR